MTVRVNQIFSSLLVLLWLALPLCAVAGELTGEASLSLADYTNDIAGRRVVAASHFAQRYSILYADKGSFVNGRGGQWQGNIGYEWNKLDWTINGNDDSITTDKIFYRGELTFAPGGLPFRFNAFAEDTHRTSFLSTTAATQGGSGILPADIYSDVNNGQHSTLGMTLLIGIRNGSYLGSYRDVLSQLPRLLVDYRQSLVRNLESRTPQHYLERDLAFVSLNKKDNWVHFRLKDYTDYLNVTNNFSEKSVTLGTIDQRLNRQWINLTNWVKISADGTWAMTRDNENRGDNPVESYFLNMFGSANRQGFSLMAPFHFERTFDKELLLRKMDAPVMMKGKLSDATQWRANFSCERKSEEYAQVGAEDSDITDLTFSGGLEWRRSSMAIVDFSAEVERYRDFGADAQTLRGAVGVRTPRGARRDLEYAATFATIQQGGMSPDVAALGYSEQHLELLAAGNPTARLRVGVSQSATIGQGNADQRLARHIRMSGIATLSRSNITREQRVGGVRHFVTSLFAEHNGKSGVENRVTASIDALNNHVGVGRQYLFNHTLTYDRPRLRLNMSTDLTFGDSGYTTGLESNVLNVVEGMTYGNVDIHHSSTLTYTPNRSFEGRLNGSYGQRRGQNREVQRYSITEESIYRYFTINGIIRQLANISQKVTYEQFDVSGADSKGCDVSLIGTLYPTKYWYVGSELTREMRFAPDSYSLSTVKMNTGINFTRLQIDLSYFVGMRPEADINGVLQDKAHEERWQVQVKKTF